MNIEIHNLKALMAEYLATLDDANIDEVRGTTHDAAEIHMLGFTDWLHKKQTVSLRLTIDVVYDPKNTSLETLVRNLKVVATQAKDQEILTFPDDAEVKEFSYSVFNNNTGELML